MVIKSEVEVEIGRRSLVLSLNLDSYYVSHREAICVAAFG